jgi:hypothetical protein
MKWEDLDFPFFTLTSVGTYNPLASTVLQLDDFVGPNGETETPTDTIAEEHDCPFSDDDVKESDFGIMVGLITCFALLVVMVAMSLLIWRKFWYCTVIPLDHRAPFSQSDLQ